MLVGHPDVCTELRPEMAEEFFMYGYIPEPYSAYQNIFKLEPGHTITVRPQSVLASKQYWDLPTPSRILSWEETQYSLIDKLKEAVNIRLVADVPLGAFLSGGVDSSAIVALMAELQDSPVNTCSIGFDERDFDESDYAQQVAERYHTHHWQEIVSPHDISLIDQLADIYDEPYADSSACLHTKCVNWPASGSKSRYQVMAGMKFLAAIVVIVCIWPSSACVMPFRNRFVNPCLAHWEISILKPIGHPARCAQRPPFSLWP